MKDDNSTPTTSGQDTSPNEFERGRPTTVRRDQAEAAIERLRKEGGVFVNAVRATPMAMAITDPTLQGNPIVFANDSFLKLSGYRMEEVLGQQPHFMNGPDTDPKDVARFIEALQSDQDDLVETVQYRKNGSRFIATVLLSAFKDADGRTLNHFMSWLDVTRRVDAEDEVSELRRTKTALQASEAKYRGLFDSIDEGFCVIEVLFDEAGKAKDYRFMEVNPSFERQTGLIDAEGKLMRSLAPDHEDHWFERYGRIARTGEPDRFADVAAALGRWYDVYAFRVGRPEDNRVAILFNDITQRRRAEQELVTSNQLLRTTFDSSLQILQLFKPVRDEKGAIVDFEWLLTNKQWDDQWGSNVGKRLLTENPAVVETGVWDKFLEVMKTGRPITHEHYYCHEQFDGWFFQTIAKANDGILLTTLDITDRKRAEQAAHESEKHANMLLAELQHRVRNTLAVVRSMARRTAQSTPDGAEFMSHFEGRLNAFSRVQAVVTRSAGGSVELGSLVEDELLTLAAHQGEHLRIEGPQICLTPRAAESMSLAVHELATNAMKYGALTTPRGRIHVSWRRVKNNPDMLQFEWRESGLETRPTAGREGFGHELLLRSLPYDLGAKTNIEFESDGLRFTMTLPMAPEVIALQASNAVK